MEQRVSNLESKEKELESKIEALEKKFGTTHHDDGISHKQFLNVEHELETKLGNILEPKIPKKNKQEGLDVKFGARKLIENWESNGSAKVGTLSGLAGGGILGGWFGGVVGGSTTGAAIGSLIVPGAGTIVGTIVGGVFGIGLVGFSGAVLGGEIGKRLDPKRGYIDRKELDSDASKISQGVTQITNSSSLLGVVSGVRSIVGVIFSRYSKGEKEIPISKLRVMLQDLGYFMNDTELKTLSQELDINGNGALQFDEFYAWYDSNDKFVKVESAVRTAKKIGEMFRSYDKDSSGALNTKEFGTFYQHFTKNQDYKAPVPVEEVLQSLKLNKNGEVPYNEFVKFEMGFFKRKYHLE